PRDAARHPATASEAAGGHSVVACRGRGGPITIRYTGPSAVPPVYGIWRTDGEPARRVATLVGDRQTHSIRWDAQVSGRPAPPGRYAVSVTVENRALIAGSAPPRLPPTRLMAVPHTGF